MATLNPDRLKENLTKAVLASLKAQQEVVVTGLLDMQADMINRVFKDGLTSDESNIGKYSTEPIYVSIASVNSQVRASSLKPRGKQKGSRAAATKRTKLVTNKFNGRKIPQERSSMYLAGGYFEFRAVVGRQNDKVDLALTFALRNSIQVGTTENGATLAFNNENELKKAEGNEKRFGKIIFDASEMEIQRLIDKFENEVSDAFFNSLDE